MTAWNSLKSPKPALNTAKQEEFAGFHTLKILWFQRMSEESCAWIKTTIMLGYWNLSGVWENQAVEVLDMAGHIFHAC